jgi:ribonucleoside-diphosphate reductase alpha chain
MITRTATDLFTPVPKPSTNATVHDRAEVLKEALRCFRGDELAATTWVNKYALRNGEGHLIEKSPADMHRRMAREFARIERKYAPIPAERKALLSTYGRERTAMDEARIFDLFDGFRDVVPQGSVMASLGDPYRLASLSNCVVIPSPLDSYGGIFHNDQQLAQLFKRRCGVGFDLSTLRPEGAP